MKLYLDVNDLNSRLAALFSEEGLSVQNMEWGMSDTGTTLMVELDALPDGSNKPLRTVVAELTERVRALEEAPPQVVYEPAPVQQQQNPKHHQKKQKGGPQAPVGVTPRMLKAAQEIEAEANIIGPKLQRGERRRGPNEYEDFPG